VSSRRKPSTLDIRTILSEAVPPPTQVESQLPPDPNAKAIAAEPPTDAPEQLSVVGWRKSTIPFRENQHKEIGRLLSKLHHEYDVQLTIAEIVRLGLDKMIEALNSESERDEALRELYQQQKRESEGNENLKHSRSRGLGRYLAARNLQID
jgi:hypothetical protein